MIPRTVLFGDIQDSLNMSRKPAGRPGWSWICEWNEKGGVGGGLTGGCKKSVFPAVEPMPEDVPVRVMYHSAIRWRWGIDSPQDARFWGFMWEHLGCCRWPFSYPNMALPMLDASCHLFFSLRPLVRSLVSFSNMALPTTDLNSVDCHFPIQHGTPHIGCFLSFVFYFAASGHVSG